MKTICLWRDQSGSTSIEYSLIAAFIALIIVGSLLALGSKINKPLEAVSDTLQNSIN